jgi:hypothetical protein
MGMEPVDWEDLPSMRGLTPLQRRFVLAQAADPFGTQADWARAAGYSDASEGAKVIGCNLMRSVRIQTATAEVARYTLGFEGPHLAAAGLLRIARNEDHPQHLKALELILDRVGMHAQSEHRVQVEHTDRTGKALEARLRAAALELGIDVSQFLGVNSQTGQKLIEAQAVEVKDAV